MMQHGEKGQALIIVLALVALGGLIISPFLGHAGSNLTGSRLYGEMLQQQYASDAGVEHAIWDLNYGDLADQLPNPGDNVTYQLGEAINGTTPDITVFREEDSGGNPVYEITSTADGQAIQAVIEISGGTVIVQAWQITS